MALEPQEKHTEGGRVTSPSILIALLAADLAWICGEADGLVMMPGWEASPGARAEAAVALALSLPAWELACFLLYGSDAPTIKSAATIPTSQNAYLTFRVGMSYPASRLAMTCGKRITRRTIRAAPQNRVMLNGLRFWH